MHALYIASGDDIWLLAKCQRRICACYFGNMILYITSTPLTEKMRTSIFIIDKPYCLWTGVANCLYANREFRDFVYGNWWSLVLRIKSYFRVKSYERNNKGHTWAMYKDNNKKKYQKRHIHNKSCFCVMYWVELLGWNSWWTPQISISFTVIQMVGHVFVSALI